MGKVIHNKSENFCLNESEILKLKDIYALNKYESARICLHTSDEDILHQMIIIMGREVYVKPHKHQKVESFQIIEGEIEINLFDDTGKCYESIVLNSDLKCYIYRIGKNVWHNIRVISEVAIFQEITLGPFVKGENLQYATW